MKKLIFVILIITIFSGCDRGKLTKSNEVMTDLILAPQNVGSALVNDKAQNNPSYSSKPIPKKIIKEGEISFETPNIHESRKLIYDNLQKLDGYVAEESESNDTSSTRSEIVLKVRIPAKNFDQFLNIVVKNAVKVDSKTIRARDVTAQYIDIETHLANKKKLENRYVELLKKGNKMSDLLQIENKISQIETSIDSTQEQLNYLQNVVDYSSLNITFYTKKEYRTIGNPFIVKLSNALSDGWQGLISFFLGVLTVWPFLVIALILFFPMKRWFKKRSIRKKG